MHVELFSCKWCCCAQHVESGGGGETHKYWPLFWPWGTVWHLPESGKTSDALAAFSPVMDIFPPIHLSLCLSFLLFLSSLLSFLLCFSCLSALPCIATFLIQRHPSSKVYICEQHLHMHKESQFQALVLAGVEPEVLKYKHFLISHSLDNRWPNLCSKIVFNSV